MHVERRSMILLVRVRAVVGEDVLDCWAYVHQRGHPRQEHQQKQPQGPLPRAYGLRDSQRASAQLHQQTPSRGPGSHRELEGALLLRRSCCRYGRIRWRRPHSQRSGEVKGAGGYDRGGRRCHLHILDAADLYHEAREEVSLIAIAKV